MSQLHAGAATEQGERNEIIVTVVLVAALIIGAVLRIYGAGTWDLRGDEPITIATALEDPGARGLFSLYYYVSRVFLELPLDRIWAGRLPAVVSGILGLFAFYWFAREAIGRVGATCGTALVCVSAFHIEISQFARYYATVFLFGSLHFGFFLRYLRSAKLRHWILALVCAAAATSSHFVASLSLVITGLYCLLALKVDVLAPVPQVRKTLAISLGIGAVGALAASPIVFRLVSVWLGYEPWKTPPWRLIPVLTLDHLTLAVSAAVGFGLWWLWHRADRNVAVLAIIAIGVTLPALAIGGYLMNFVPRYVTVSFPWFYLAAGACCSGIYNQTRDAVGPIGAWAPLGLLVAASLPATASYFIERSSISYASAFTYVVDRAAQGDVIETNVELRFGNDVVAISDYRSEVWDAGYPWPEELDESPATWFVYEVGRRGYAPSLEDWLIEHAQKVDTRWAPRVDRHVRRLDIWRLHERPNP